MRYFMCEVCGHEDVPQSDMVSWCASICEQCEKKKDNKELIEKLNKDAQESYYNRR